MLGNILVVGAEGTVQGGDVGAFGTVDQKDVVAAGTARKSVFAVSYQSSVFRPGLKVIDPMLEVGDGRFVWWDIPPPPDVPRHARTSITRVVRFRQARCPIPRRRRDLPGTLSLNFAVGVGQ